MCCLTMREFVERTLYSSNPRVLCCFRVMRRPPSVRRSHIGLAVPVDDLAGAALKFKRAFEMSPFVSLPITRSAPNNPIFPERSRQTC